MSRLKYWESQAACATLHTAVFCCEPHNNWRRRTQASRRSSFTTFLLSIKMRREIRLSGCLTKGEGQESRRDFVCYAGVQLFRSRSLEKRNRLGLATLW